MKHLMFSIYDDKANAYLPPFTLPRAEMAQRTFSDCVNSENHAFALHPGDYTLYELGVFDDETAEINSHDVRVNLGVGLAFKQLSLILEDETHGQPLGDDSSIQPSTSGGNSA